MADDPRIHFQAEYLTGVHLVRSGWAALAVNDHDHCEFCGATFSTSEVDGRPIHLREGWATPDGENWICDRCFDDFHERFAWVVDVPSA